jgi:F-type H+-transporting ATPase subunit a
MTAGEILVLIAAFIFPFAVSWVVYGLELFVGFIQALVFAGLTLVFVTMAVSSHEAESHKDLKNSEKEVLKEGT